MGSAGRERPAATQQRQSGGHGGESRQPSSFTEPKNLLLKATDPATQAVRTGAGHDLTVTSGNTLAKGVMLSCSVPGAVFQQNFFDLLPGEPQTVQV